jgi:hypothetical protein
VVTQIEELSLMCRDITLYLELGSLRSGVTITGPHNFDVEKLKEFFMNDQVEGRGPEDEDDDEERYDPEKGDVPDRGAASDESQETPPPDSPTHDPAEGGGGASQGGGTGNP